ncbi:MAG: rhodanese-like domain-containing protein [Nitrospinota bacterium]
MRRFGLFLFVSSLMALLIMVGNTHALTEEEISRKVKNPGQIKISAELFTRKLRKHNPEFVISLESVLQKLREKQDIILIDIRNRKEFEKFRIPGSINISLFAIKTKAFLKAKPLVLINEGYSYSQLEQECKRLRDSGFTSVLILNGGLNYWGQKGAPLEGDLFAQKKINKISPRIFFAERNYENWIVIDISESKQSEADNLMPQAIPIPYSDDPEGFVSKFEAAIGKQNSNPFLSVLIFNDNGEQYEEIEKLIEKIGIKNVFYLKGGLEKYKTFLQQQALIRQPRNNLKKTLKKCRSCP